MRHDRHTSAVTLCADYKVNPAYAHQNLTSGTCLIFSAATLGVHREVSAANPSNLTQVFSYDACIITGLQVIHMCAVTHSSVCHDSFICVTWLIHMHDMTHSSAWHDSFTCVTLLIHLYEIFRLPCTETPPNILVHLYMCINMYMYLHNIYM